MNTPSPPTPPFEIIDLGRMAYQPAWEYQQDIHAQRVADPKLPPALIFVEHDPVITISQRQASPGHLLASREQLAKRGIDVQPTNRGGDITYHGPGQLVAYPIIRLASYQLNVGRYMRLLETVVINTLLTFDIQAQREAGHVGVWVNQQGHQSHQVQAAAKICALGVRVSRNITLHGLALNVTPDLSHFDTIIPCGLADRSVTSMAKILGDQTPSMTQVKKALVQAFSLELGCDKL